MSTRTGRIAFVGTILLLFAAGCGDGDLAAWRAALEDRSPGRRCEAAAHLARAGEPGALDVLLDHALSLDDQEWRAASLYLPAVGSLASGSLDRVVRHEDRLRVVRALGAVGSEAKPHLAVIEAALADNRDGALTAEASWALYRVTGDAPEATRRLLRALAGATAPGLRQMAADRLLGIANQDPGPLIDALAERSTAELAAALLARVKRGSPGYAAARAALASRERPAPD